MPEPPRATVACREISSEEFVVAVHTKTLIGNAQGLFRAGIRRLLSDVEGLRVVGEAADAEELVEWTAEAEADLVIVDLDRSQPSAVEAIRRIVESGSKARILVLAADASPARLRQALRAGACGVVSKSAAGRELVAAVESIRVGGSYLCPASARVLTRATPEPESSGSPLACLSAREREVLAWLAEGLSSREIGERLSVSPRTIDSHRVRLMKKLGIHKVQGLVRLAIREGLIEA